MLTREYGLIDLVIPTSVSDLDGYGPARLATTTHADVREPLTGYGIERFARVFMPCMRFAAQRKPGLTGRVGYWAVRADGQNFFDDGGLLRLLSNMDVLPKELFGDVGFVSNAETKVLITPLGDENIPILIGGDIEEWCEPVPRLGIAKGVLQPRDHRQLDAAVLLRQTSIFPIAALAGTWNFRNSVLGVFESARWPALRLLGLLNSRLIRWFHYNSFRDAREGIPQLKIGHLRKYPAPMNEEIMFKLDGPAQRLLRAPADQEARDELNEAVEVAYGLDERQRGVLADWDRQILNDASIGARA